jgi:hypothetical protein
MLVFTHTHTHTHSHTHACTHMFVHSYPVGFVSSGNYDNKYIIYLAYGGARLYFHIFKILPYSMTHYSLPINALLLGNICANVRDNNLAIHINILLKVHISRNFFKVNSHI